MKEMREGKFITQRELAAKAGVGLSTIVPFELSRQKPRISTARQLAAALGVKPGELVAEETDAGS